MALDFGDEAQESCSMAFLPWWLKLFLLSADFVWFFIYLAVWYHLALHCLSWASNVGCRFANAAPAPNYATKNRFFTHFSYANISPIDNLPDVSTYPAESSLDWEHYFCLRWRSPWAADGQKRTHPRPERKRDIEINIRTSGRANLIEHKKS